MSDRMTLDHIDTLTADNRDLTTRIVGLEAERDHHRVGLVRVRAEADTALARAAELEAALRNLVASLPICNYHGCGAPAAWRMPYGPMCDEHKPRDADDYFAMPHHDALTRALALLRKEP